MRKALLGAGCVLLLVVCAYFGASARQESRAIRLRLVDAADGGARPGLVRVFRKGANTPLILPGPIDLKDAAAGWYVLPPEGAEVHLPRAEVRLEAVSGLETALTHRDLDLTAAAPAEVTLPLHVLFRPEKEGLAAGVTGPGRGNGEEHRHEFYRGGPGYGRVLLFGIHRPDATGTGDDQPLAPAIEAARRQGATVVWCHGPNGLEEIVEALAGRIDVLNVSGGGFEEDYDRLLNVGLRLPLGTEGTPDDFARVYANVGGEVTVSTWLEAVKAGRCQVTNGPLLTLRVDGRGPGQTVRLERPGTVRIEVRAVGRHDFQRLQLVHNGKAVRSERAVPVGDGFAARLAEDEPVDSPGWLAARVETAARNEFDRPLFAHTSPVYVAMDGGRPFDEAAAQALRQRLREAQAVIRGRGRFRSPEARARVLSLFDRAAADSRLTRTSSPPAGPPAAPPSGRIRTSPAPGPPSSSTPSPR